MTEKHRKLELELTPEKRAIQAIDGMYASMDVQAAAQEHLDNLNGSIIFPDGEVVVTHRKAQYRFGLGENKQISGSHIFNGHEVKEQVSVEEGEPKYVVFVKDKQKEEYFLRDEVDSEEEVSKILSFAATFHADSNFLRAMAISGLVWGASVEDSDLGSDTALGIIVSREPEEAEKVEIARNIRGIDIQYRVLPLSVFAGSQEPRKWSYDEALVIQALVRYRANELGLELQSELVSGGEKGVFKVNYRLDIPPTKDQQTVLFRGLDERNLSIEGKRLVAKAH